MPNVVRTFFDISLSMCYFGCNCKFVAGLIYFGKVEFSVESLFLLVSLIFAFGICFILEWRHRKKHHQSR